MSSPVSRSSAFCSKLEVLADLEDTSVNSSRNMKRNGRLVSVEFLPAGPDDLNDAVIKSFATGRAVSLIRRASPSQSTSSRRRTPAFPPPDRRVARQPDVLEPLEQALDRRRGPSRQHTSRLRPGLAVSQLLGARSTAVQVHPERFYPSGRGPVQVFIYTTCQERATQISHLNTETRRRAGTASRGCHPEDRTGRVTPLRVLHERLPRDPGSRPEPGLEAASSIMPAIDMPGISISNFNDYADVIRRAGSTDRATTSSSSRTYP